MPRARAVSAPCSLLKSNGGHALGDEARRRPAHLLLSGIAGGAIGGAWFARNAGADQAIMLDMGGTSCDVCMIVGGEPPRYLGVDAPRKFSPFLAAQFLNALSRRERCADRRNAEFPLLRVRIAFHL